MLLNHINTAQSSQQISDWVDQNFAGDMLSSIRWSLPMALIDPETGLNKFVSTLFVEELSGNTDFYLVEHTEDGVKFLGTTGLDETCASYSPPNLEYEPATEKKVDLVLATDPSLQDPLKRVLTLNKGIHMPKMIYTPFAPYFNGHVVFRHGEWESEPIYAPNWKTFLHCANDAALASGDTRLDGWNFLGHDKGNLMSVVLTLTKVDAREVVNA